MTPLRLANPQSPALDEFDAAAKIAECLREQAERMPLDSPLRALALRSATRWSTQAGLRPVNLRALAPVFGDHDDREEG